MTSRVLHITRDFPPRWAGGISTALWGIVDAQRASGTDVDVISFDAWRPRRASDYYPLPDDPHESAPRDAIGALRVWRVRDADSPDIIQRRILEGGYDEIEIHVAMLWPAAFEAAQQRSTRTLYMAHVLSSAMDTLRGLQTPSLSAQAEDLALQQADRIIVPSNYVQSTLAPDLQAKATVRRLRLVDADFPPIVPPRHRKWDIVYSARFSDLKSTLPALDVIAEVLSSNHSARACVIGGLPESLKTERKLLARWSEHQSHEVLSRIDFTGWLHRADALARYANSRVFLSTSQIETWGLAVAEALRCECRVVASDIGAHREQQQLHQALTLVPLSAPRELWADAIRSHLK